MSVAFKRHVYGCASLETKFVVRVFGIPPSVKRKFLERIFAEAYKSSEVNSVRELPCLRNLYS